MGFLLDPTCAGAQGGVAPALHGGPFAADGVRLSLLFPNGQADGTAPAARIRPEGCAGCSAVYCGYNKM